MPRPRLLLDAIDSWRNTDFRPLTDAQVRGRLQGLLDAIKYFATGSLSIDGVRTVYRARFVQHAETKNRWPWTTPSELLYPPAATAPRGRCNIAGEPALYCAKDLITCLREMRAAPGDEVVLSSYQVHHASLAVVVPKNKTVAIDGRPMFDDDGAVSFLIFREFVRSEFTKPVGKGTEFLYKLSAALSHVVFDGPDNDGWVYPSVESPSHECLAFKPACVDSDRFSIATASRFTILNEQDRSFAVTRTERAVFENGGIAWVPAPGPSRWVAADRHPGDPPLVLVE